MSLFHHLPKRAGAYLLVGALALLSLNQQNTPDEPLRAPLLSLRAEQQRALEVVANNLRNQYTPGYKARSSWGGESNLVWAQGEIFKTQTPTNLAVNGQGCFRLKAEGRLAYTRDGRFSFSEGVLQSSDGWEVQGMPLDRLGNIIGEPGPIKLSTDPTTMLYEGRYTDYSFDETGKLYGHLTQTDPVTGQCVRASTPLYQVVLCQFPNPAGLSDVPGTAPNLWAESEASGQPMTGIAGQGALGCVCPSSLELSNVDFAHEGETFKWLKQHREAFRQLLSPSRLEREMPRRMAQDPLLLGSCLENLSHRLSPGYRSWDLLGYLQDGKMRLRLNPGRYLTTRNSLDVALHGEAYLALDNGQITRDGHLLWSSQGLRAGKKDGPLVLGYRPGSQTAEPICLPEQASALEINSWGEFSWVDFNGTGEAQQGPRLALALPSDPQKLRREGLHFYPQCACRFGPAGPGFGTSLEQGVLECSNQDVYEEKLIAPSLLELSGLPSFNLR